MRFLPILLVLLSSLVYVGWHIWAIAPLPVWGKWTLVGVAIVLFALEFVGFTPLMNRMPLWMSSCVYNVGNKSVIVLFYLLMAFVVLDLGRLVHIVPRSLLHESLPATAVLTVLMVGIFVYASVHYHHKECVSLELDSSGRLQQPVTVVMASDLHIGYHNRRADLAKWVDMINAEHPDLVLIAGDIVDFSFRPVIEEDMAAEFRRIEAPVYACLGNHEYYSGEPEAQRFYQEAGIHLLRDTSAVVGDLCLLGRDDRSNLGRKDVAAIVRDADMQKYTILLDHQPYHLERTERAGIDFQFSGHTHYGQVWPISWITDAIYECAFGPHQRGNTRYYVSSGIGIWGGKFRIGTRSEYVVATLDNKE